MRTSFNSLRTERSEIKLQHRMRINGSPLTRLFVATILCPDEVDLCWVCPIASSERSWTCKPLEEEIFMQQPEGYIPVHYTARHLDAGISWVSTCVFIKKDNERNAAYKFANRILENYATVSGLVLNRMKKPWIHP